MHLRISQVTRNGTTYRYAQLVESYRRPRDGQPVVRVIHSLGRLTAEQEANWRVCLEAQREGKRVAVVESAPAGAPAREAPAANLSYLDVAVLHRLWQHSGMPELLDRCMRAGDSDVLPRDVVEAMCIQRCVAPSSKSALPAWFEATALPELIGIAPGQMNNTRIHRVLDALDVASTKLQAELPRLVREQAGAFAVVFADVTDSWFVGRGPELAELGQTKEGRFERKVQIVLLCDQDGHPLRWHVEPGNRHDSGIMHDVVDSISEQPWIRDVPIVFDRAMGKSAHLRKLLATGIHFLTAITRDEFSKYVADIPTDAFRNFELTNHSEPCVVDVERARELARAAGWTEVSPTLFLLDQNVRAWCQVDSDDTIAPPDPEMHITQRAMIWCRRIEELGRISNGASMRSLGLSLGLSRKQLSEYCKLRKLDESIQQSLLAGNGVRLTLVQLTELAQLSSKTKQCESYARLLAEGSNLTKERGRRRPVDQSTASPEYKVVAYFNPEMFVRARINAAALQMDLMRFVDKTNASLAHPRPRRTETKIRAGVEARLSALGLVQAYSIHIDSKDAHDAATQDGPETGQSRYVVRLELDPDDWHKRRMYDGFSVLVGHPRLSLTAEQMCTTYRAKDAVERDFRTIKSVISLRPFHHRLDAKVRAHVTVCALALLLERVLAKKLAKSNTQWTPARALETLAGARLNYYPARAGAMPRYQLNQLSQDQALLLRILRLKELAQEEEIQAAIHPR